MASDKIIGIDLGTTNSAFAVVEGDEPEIIVNAEGERTTPSVLSFSEDGEELVGKPAKNQAVQNHERTIQSIKRHMGDEDYTVSIEGEEYTPEEVSAKILQKIKDDAEEYIGSSVDKAVITVPAYFNDKQRQATKNAGEIAGFEVERIINEPTAAAMAYGIDEDEDKKLLVYDLGGGTFDVSVLDIGGGVYEVVATNGDNDLGGDDWDEEVVDYIAEEFEEQHGVDLREDSQALQRLKNAAEDAKIELSSVKETDISLPFIGSKDDEPLHVDTSITREKFTELTQHLIDRTEEPTNQALEDAGLSTSDIDDVLLIGGSTRMPQVKDKVNDIMGVEPQMHVNPDEAVALGAARQGAVINEDVDDVVLLDVTPLSLGVETKGGLFEKVIEKNTTIPTKATKRFTTARDGQSSVKVKVFQGERDIAEENELLAQFALRDIPNAPAGEPDIVVTFEIDEDGILDVEAEEKESGKQKEITIEGGVGMSDEKVEELKQKASEYEEEDKEKKEKITAKNDAEEKIREAEDRLVQEEISESLQTEIRDKIEELEDELVKSELDADKLNEKRKDLGNSLRKIGREGN